MTANCTRHAMPRIAPRPYVFRTKDELLDILGGKETAETIEAFIRRNESDIATIVKASVSGNTFRAFSLPDGLRPSVIYRSWVTERLTTALGDIQRLSSTSHMRALIISAANDLSAHWHVATQGKREIGFGRAAKLLNLSVKHMLWHDQIPRDQKYLILHALEVPLDSFTLQGIRRVLPELGIPHSASMGYVRDAVHYSLIQDAIRELCAPRFSPIYYEYAAWNLAHSGRRHDSKC